MEQPLVSVVVISYNHSKYIPEILNSLKNQTYTNWELIVADDASADQSVKEFDNWLAINKITAKKIYHSTNTGLATVLNESMELCAGEYVKFIAADDYLHPEYLEKTTQFLEEKGPTFGMVFTDTFAINESSNLIADIADYNKLGSISPQEFSKQLIKGNRIAALTVLMRKNVVEETGKYDSKFIVEDYYRWLKISEKYLIAYLPEKLAYYRLHTENISKTKASQINSETLMLQIMFDHEGIVKDKINGFIEGQYLFNKKIPKDLFDLYQNYPYHSKRLKFCLKNNIPPIIYRIVSKFI